MAKPAIYNPVLGTDKDKGLISKPFRFLENFSPTLMPQVYVHFKAPRLVKGPRRWYVEYWYRIPPELKEKPRPIWKRFKVFEDINRYKTDEYANVLLKAVTDELKDGYNPFTKHKRKFTESAEAKEKSLKWSLSISLERFMEYSKDKGLRPKTLQTYGIVTNFLNEYFIKGNKVYQPIESFTKDDFKAFFKKMKAEKEWNNFTTNNYIRYTKTILNWLVREDILPKNPAQGIEEYAVNITRHKYYSDEIAEKIKNSVRTGNPELFELIQFVYYTATRPKSETRLLQVKNILWDRKLLFIPASVSKNKQDDYIPLHEELLKMLENRKDWPAEHYIFGGKKPRSANYHAQLYKPYKDKFGLTADHSIYSWKHSRAIHLALAGADPYQIMKLFRHSGLDVTMKYLRDLGISDMTDIEAKTKAF